MIKVSIITVCFNSEVTIRDTIESVLSQSYPNIEYIIIDGSSSDGTMEIVEEYKGRISTIISEMDRGIYDAMNKGIRMATGDVVGILNSDDIYAEMSIIANVVDILECDKKIDGIYGDIVYVDRNDTNKKVRTYSSRFFSKWKIRFGFMLPHPTLYLRRSVFSKVGFYRINYRVAADFEFITRLFMKNIYLKRVSKVMVKMREGGISSSGVWWRIHQNLEIVRACRENAMYTNIFMVSIKVPFKIFNYIKG